MSKFYSFYNEMVKTNNHIRLDFCGDINLLLEYLHKDVQTRRIAEQAYFNQIEKEVLQKFHFLEQLIANFNNVISLRNQLVAKKLVLTEASRTLNVKEAN